jgi:hypothetical protein
MMGRGLVLLLVGLLGGCIQATLEPSSNASLTTRDRQLLAHPPYARADIPETYRRHIVDYTRKEQPGTILVDTNARYLYYVLPAGKAIRYGVTVGEEALAWSGVALPEARCRRSGQPARRAGDLSLRGQQGHAVPHPRHQPAGIYRSGHLVRMHPHDQ